jgi:CubicO group peptidase (beta-lactamase class C family)
LNGAITTLPITRLFSVLTLAAAAVWNISAAPVNFASLVKPREPGMAVLVRRNGHTVFQAGYGVCELHNFSRIDQRTNFRLASFTKQFTAMSTMLLVHDGKLRYDQRLTDIIPDFPEYGRNITIRHLLTHTSGLPDYEDLMEETEKTHGPAWTDTRQINDEEVLSLLMRGRPKFAPGTSWSYSNSGYVLLGWIVAKVSEEPFETFLQDRIFRPLKMTHTLAYVNGRNVVPHRAFGHTKQGERFVETDQSPTSATLGDGGIYSNLEDLAKWDEALERHSLLSEEESSVALIPVKLSDGPEPNAGEPVSYGFGWFLDPYQGHARMWHPGSTVGFRTVIERFPAERLTVIVLCNRTDLDAAKLALQAADAFLKGK